MSSSPVPRILISTDVDWLSRMYDYYPTKFARKPRSLSFAAQWKSTEWRNWVLYTGLVLLDVLLNHCTLFTYRILKLRLSHACKAQLGFRYVKTRWRGVGPFIYQCNTLFNGWWFMSSSVHASTHLATDALKYDTIDGFSSLKFEDLFFGWRILSDVKTTPSNS